jgi:hypothetical protein
MTVLVISTKKQLYENYLVLVLPFISLVSIKSLCMFQKRKENQYVLLISCPWEQSQENTIANMYGF